jgi:hypothetical protein
LLWLLIDLKQDFWRMGAYDGDGDGNSKSDGGDDCHVTTGDHCILKKIARAITKVEPALWWAGAALLC